MYLAANYRFFQSDMKKILYQAVILLFSCSTAYAQNVSFLFEDFTEASIMLRGGSVSKVKFNFDSEGQKIYYMQGDVVMEMTNCYLIDTIKVRDRRFVWKDSRLCERLLIDGHEVLINWHVTESYVGKEGAMGLTTQGKAETYYVPGLNSKYSLETRGKYKDETEVWKTKSDNTYYFTLQGKDCKVRRPKEIYKLFPQYEDELKDFIRKNNLVMTNAVQALIIIEQLMTISQN